MAGKSLSAARGLCGGDRYSCTCSSPTLPFLPFASSLPQWETSVLLGLRREPIPVVVAQACCPYMVRGQECVATQSVLLGLAVNWGEVGARARAHSEGVGCGKGQGWVISSSWCTRLLVSEESRLPMFICSFVRH